MPRNRPGAVRAARTRIQGYRTLSRIRGVHWRTRRAIELAEIRELGAGRVQDVLDRYRGLLDGPGRWLALPPPIGCPGCDLTYARHDVADVLRALPPAARADLRRIVAPLDDRFRRRTLPEPNAAGDAWWLRRVHEW